MAEGGSYEISTWDGSEAAAAAAQIIQAEEKPKLRRPYKPGEQPVKPPAGINSEATVTASGGSSIRSVNNMPKSYDVVQSKLNPNAKSFSPLSNTFSTPSTIYNAQQLSAADDKSLVHVPSMSPMESPSSGSSVVSVPSEHVDYASSGSDEYSMPTATNLDIMSNVKHVFSVMSVNPGCFDEYIEHLITALNTNPLDAHQFDNLIEYIYEQAIFDTNFTYTAAKVCNCLCSRLAVQPGIKPFRDCLMAKLKKEFHEREASLNDPTFIDRVYQFTMFIAELFLNMEIITDNKPNKVAILRNALHGLMESLLKYLNDDNTRVLIKLLKLTGAQIEDFDRESGKKTQLQSLFLTIRNIILDSKLSRTTRTMLLDLIELRASNWGRDTSSPTAQLMHSNSAAGDSAVGVMESDAFTFYSPDGKVISEEEANKIYVNENDLNNMDEYFNKWSLGNNEKSNNYNDDEYQYGSDTNSLGPEMFDDEVAQAFDEYLQMTDNR